MTFPGFALQENAAREGEQSEADCFIAGARVKVRTKKTVYDRGKRLEQNFKFLRLTNKL